MANLHIKIKEFRKNNKMTQGEMAKRLGITQSALSQIENGDQSNMKVGTLEKICKEFKLSADDLLGLSDRK